MLVLGILTIASWLTVYILNIFVHNEFIEIVGIHETWTSEEVINKL